jgi:hypothetical protein
LIKVDFKTASQEVKWFPTKDLRAFVQEGKEQLNEDELFDVIMAKISKKTLN